MMRNWKQIAGLGALLLSLGGLATWDEWKTKKDEKEKETKGLALSIKPDSVIGIVLHSTGDSEGGDKAPESKIDPSTIIDVTIKLNSGLQGQLQGSDTPNEAGIGGSFRSGWVPSQSPFRTCW